MDGALELIPELAAFARADLDGSDSPLDAMPRLSKALGVALSVKRDDVLRLAMGGNKIRQLEYYLGPAVRDGADMVLITGAIQSNFVRLCAAAARRLGMKPVVQLEARVPKSDPFYNASGNVLLDNLLGAEIHHFSEGENEVAADANLDRLAEHARQLGYNPYVVHLGIDHPPIGGMGYVLAAAETYLQHQSRGTLPDHVVIPSGSALTHSGFLVGARAIGWDVQIHGICVRRDAASQKTRVTRRVNELAQLLRPGLNVSESDILVYDSVLAPGYGQMNEAVAKAIALAAQSEALLLDPVYSGRCFAGMMSLINNGAIKPNQKVTFIHTGGLPAIFGYQTDLLNHLR